MIREILLIVFALVPATVVSSLPYILEAQGATRWLALAVAIVLGILTCVVIYLWCRDIDKASDARRKAADNARNEKLMKDLLAAINRAGEERNQELVSTMTQSICRVLGNAMQKQNEAIESALQLLEPKGRDEEY